MSSSANPTDVAVVAAWEVSLIREADFESMSKMCAEAFKEKRARLCCLVQPMSATANSTEKAYKEYAKKFPQKLAHCAVVRDDDGQVVGTCQLQIGSSPGDMRMTPDMRHHLQKGECYVEWIGVSESARGKGVGSKLLAWAEETARRERCRFMSLEVMNENKRAADLYRRKGFEQSPNPDGEDPISKACACCFIWFFMGCRYCSTLYMTKGL